MCREKPTKVKVLGNDFDYCPIIGNDGKFFRKGDFAINGRITPDRFGKRLIYDGDEGIPTSENTPIEWWLVIEEV